MKLDHGGGLPESHVGNRAVSAENTNPTLSAAGELVYAVRHVGSSGDLDHVRAKRVRTVARDDDLGFWFVFRSRWPPSRSAVPNQHATFLQLVFIVVVLCSAAADGGRNWVGGRKAHPTSPPRIGISQIEKNRKFEGKKSFKLGNEWKCNVIYTHNFVPKCDMFVQ